MQADGHSVTRNESQAAALEALRRSVLPLAARYADAVDCDARFPSEAIHAMAEAKLLAASIPADMGGLSCSASTLSDICIELGRECASAGMIVAMHFSQTFSLSRHIGESRHLKQRMRLIAQRQLLVASATSEAGIGGNIGTSHAALTRDPRGFKLEKRCTVLSYAQRADAIAVTARNSPEAQPAEQSLVLLLKDDYELQEVGSWDSLGMRGTCSPPVTLLARGDVEQILQTPFREIARRSMVPISHLLWSSVWLGVAQAAFGRARARMCARRSSAADRTEDRRLSRAALLLQSMQANVVSAATEPGLSSYTLIDRPGDSPIALALRTNNLKVASSELVWLICHECLAICGLSGYSNAGPGSLSRHLRDALSAALMVGNDRIETINAALLMLDAPNERR